MESLSSRYETERERMRGKLTESVRLLKEMKDQKDEAEEERKRQRDEMKRVQEELKRREMEVERIKREKEIEAERLREE